MGFLRALFLPTSLAILVAAALSVPLPVYLEEPGTPVSLQERVAVQAEGAGDVVGDYLLTSVSVLPGTVARVARAVLDARAELVPETLVTHGQEDRVYFDRQREVFRASADVAAAVALQAAGFEVDPTAIRGSGALVGRVLPGAPADGVLQPGDVITAVDGNPVRITDDLVGLVSRGEDEREIRVRRAGEELVVRVAPGEIPTASGRTTGLGVEIQTAEPRLDLPVPVEVDSGRIGGPSAGLMVALTVYDKAAEVDLAAGRSVAGTGTLSPEGRVGPVGSIDLKVISAEEAGADVFVAPAGQLAEARSALGPGSTLEVVGAASFEEAVSALRGGGDHAGRALPILA